MTSSRRLKSARPCSDWLAAAFKTRLTPPNTPGDPERIRGGGAANQEPPGSYHRFTCQRIETPPPPPPVTPPH